MPKKIRNKAPIRTPQRTKRLLGIGDGITTEGQLRIALARIADLRRKVDEALVFAASEHSWADHYFKCWQEALDKLAKLRGH